MVFTGIIRAVGTATWHSSSRLVVTCEEPFFASCAIGDSVACSGVCLTVVKIENAGHTAAFDVMLETRNVTVLATKTRLNLEHAMRQGDSIGGHRVSGHVVAVWRVRSFSLHPDGSADVWLEAPSPSSPPGAVVHKGSVALDGVSLTVAEVEAGARAFRVSLIPHTQAVCTLGALQPGALLNVEWDVDLAPRRDAGAWAATSPGTAAAPAPPAHAASAAPAGGAVSTSQGGASGPAAEQGAAGEAADDARFMLLALAESLRGARTAPPNPHVGCVITRNNVVVATGYHERPGQPHAEINALRALPEPGRAEGLTMYVTLEPCSHYGRTPPCADAVIAARPARVVIALVDPDVRVAGRGVAALLAAGIEVAVGVAAAAVRESLAAYVHHRVHGRPFVYAKVAASIDGATCCADGSSQWITGAAARADAGSARGAPYLPILRATLRARVQAIVVGSGTVLNDNPRLTARDSRGADLPDPQPLRVVLDGRGRTLARHADLHVFSTTSTRPTLVLTTSAAAAAGAPVRDGLTVEVLAEITPAAVLEAANRRGAVAVLVEGGADVVSSFLDAGAVDRLVVYTGAALLGSSAERWARRPVAARIADASRWRLASVVQLGDDIRAEYATTR